MSTLGEYIKEVSGDSSVQGVMDGLMKGGEGVPATEATDAYSKGLVAAATEMAEDEAAMKRDNALRMTQIPTLALANGAAMPQLAFGTGTTWFEGAASADEPAAGGAEAESPLQRCVRTALMSGYRHLDCAEMYGTEAKVGAALAAWLDYTRSSRDEVFVTSKIWRGVSDVGAACRASLQKLRLEHLDLYLLHAPVAFMCATRQRSALRGCPRRLHSSLSLPLPCRSWVEPAQRLVLQTAIWAEMESLVEQGLVRAIGVSNFSAAELTALLAHAKIKPAVNQVELHPYCQPGTGRDCSGLRTLCAEHNIVLTGYSPLAPLKKRCAQPAARFRSPLSLV